MREGVYVPNYGGYLFPSTIASIEEVSGRKITELSKADIDAYINFLFRE